MSLVLDLASIGALWLVVSVPVGVLAGRWLAHGSGEWLLNAWCDSDDEEFDRAA